MKWLDTIFLPIKLYSRDKYTRNKQKAINMKIHPETYGDANRFIQKMLL